jgi:putative pyruvate formate lyase activating enzyme
LGFCGETDQLRVAYVGPHFGEEPPISGERGSGTVFFTGCSLKCSFCQNFQLSRDHMGRHMSLDQLQKEIGEMIQRHPVHNINFVTPDHFFPHLFSLVSLLRGEGLDLPMVYNLSGFQSVGVLRMAENFVDIYLPDFKYSDASLAGRLSKCPDYPEKALEAIAEMVGQKGFLDSCSKGRGPARKGVLVRHLILPGKIENSIDALTSLFLEFGPELPVSLMSQYHPVVHQKDPDLNRSITTEEFYRVYCHAGELGFENLFVQFPEEKHSASPSISPFLPDFRRPEPFG